MDTLKPGLLLAIGLADATLWDGFFKALTASDAAPKTLEQLGTVLGTALLVVGSQFVQWWQNRKNVDKMVQAAVAKHLADCPPETPSLNGV